MREYCRKNGKKVTFSRCLEGQKTNIFLLFILILGMGLFFCAYFEKSVLAKQAEPAAVVDPEILDPMKKVGKVKAGYPLKENVQAGEIKMSYQKNMASVESIGEEIWQNKKSKYEEKYAFLSDYPIEEMIPYIAEKDEKVSAFLIGIAKKESDWGKHSPKKNGRICYNYWGYKGPHNPTASGYSCFDSPEQAVETVGSRIENLVAQGLDNPAKMIVWKCGSSCEDHDPASVKKWISDVSKYFYKLVSNPSLEYGREG